MRAAVKARTMTKGERRVKETLPPSHRLMPEKCENPARGKNVRPCVENPGTSEKLNCGLQARVQVHWKRIMKKNQQEDTETRCQSIALMARSGRHLSHRNNVDQ